MSSSTRLQTSKSVPSAYVEQDAPQARCLQLAAPLHKVRRLALYTIYSKLEAVKHQQGNSICPQLQIPLKIWLMQTLT
jgi:hypothetical protein